MKKRIIAALCLTALIGGKSYGQFVGQSNTASAVNLRQNLSLNVGNFNTFPSKLNVWGTGNTNATSALSLFNTNSSTVPMFIIKNDGSVGIGTGATSPTSHLEIVNAALGVNAGDKVEWFKSSGIVGSGNTDQLRIFNNRYTAGSNWYSSEVRIQRSVDNLNLGYIAFRGGVGDQATVVIGTNNDVLTVTNYHNGQVRIGALEMKDAIHNDAKLTVDGKIVAKSCYITLTNWADYVFAPNYKLPNLYDVEKYYLANKHLPEIPSEKEVIEKGIDVAEMNKLLLKKIEELTILMVKQQKQIDNLEKK